jgi:hypothetical protein
MFAIAQNRTGRRAPETAASHYCELPQGDIRTAHYPAVNKVGLHVRIRGHQHMGRLRDGRKRCGKSSIDCIPEHRSNRRTILAELIVACRKSGW